MYGTLPTCLKSLSRAALAISAALIKLSFILCWVSLRTFYIAVKMFQHCLIKPQYSFAI